MSLRHVVVLAVVLQGPLLAEQPLGSEFRVNTYTTNRQRLPSVAFGAGGGFVVVWGSLAEDGSGDGVFGQRYASNGAPLGTEFRVNSYTTSDQWFAFLSSDSFGDFVVVWQGYGQDGSGYGIFGQRYASNGSPSGAEFRANTYTTGDQRVPRVAMDSAGSFVVVWNTGNDGSLYGIFGQRYASDGSPLGGEFRVNAVTTDQQKVPYVSSLPSGRFVVVWQSNAEGSGGYGVFGQRYASDGSPLGGEFRVNTVTTYAQDFPSVDADATGNFVVVWQSNGQDGPGYGIFCQRFFSAGTPMGVEFRVNSYTTGSQVSARVASDAAGNFVVSWVDFSLDGSSIGVFARRFSSTGTPFGADFRVNTFTTDVQTSLIKSVASDAAGNFIVAWGSAGEDGSDYGIFAQRYCVSPLVSVSISMTMGSASLPCTTFSNNTGTATVFDVGGGATTHQWAYRTVSGGAATPISGATGSSYQLQAPDFGGTAGVFYLICFTVPECGSLQISNEITVFISNDTSGPLVTAPNPVTGLQTLCQ